MVCKNWKFKKIILGTKIPFCLKHDHVNLSLMKTDRKEKPDKIGLSDFKLESTLGMVISVR